MCVFVLESQAKFQGSGFETWEDHSEQSHLGDEMRFGRRLYKSYQTGYFNKHLLLCLDSFYGGGHSMSPLNEPKDSGALTTS